MYARRSVVIATSLSVATLSTGGAAFVVAVGRTPQHGARGVPTSMGSATPAGERTLQVNGAPIPAVDHGTVASAITAAGIAMPAGHYVAVVSHRLLGADGRQAQLFVDGRGATLKTAVFSGEQVTVRPGRNLVEPTETVRISVAAPVPSALYVGDRAGITRLVRGRLSHERVSAHVVRQPVVGHLIRPGAVALTFDDGPLPAWTGTVLALLAQHHVHATFCMIGRQAAAHPDLVRRVVRGGHALCDHTWDHDLSLASRPAGQIRLDIARGRHAIIAATHGRHQPTFFRAPGGNWSAQIERDARGLGMIPLKWNVDPRDWSRPGVRAILHTIYRELRPGGVILLHDGGGDRSQTVAALRVLLRRLPKMGYHFVLPPGATSAG